jgi:hypothetical protein
LHVTYAGRLTLMALQNCNRINKLLTSNLSVMAAP